MLRNYLITAIRNLKKGLVSTISQSIGLSIGLAVFILVNLIAEFEETFDTFFNNYQRIYTVYVDFKPEAGFGVKSTDAVYSALQPVLELNIPEIEKSSRLLGRELMVKAGDKKFYQSLSFADPDFLEILQLDFIQGDAGTALSGPNSVIISKTVAAKYFGEANPMGEKITIDNKHEMQVTAVFADLPANSHLNGSVVSDIGFEMVGTIGALVSISNFDPIGNWGSLNSDEKTYVLLPEGADPVQYENKLEQIYNQHFTTEMKEYFAGIRLRPLQSMNLYVWETSGIPALGALRVIGIIILLIACLNYMTLAAARGLSRLREVGLRKSLGATQWQLVIQFLVESIAIAFIALIIAIILTKLSIPAITQITSRELVFNVFTNPGIFGGLVVLMLITGLIAGGYPALVISRLETINALNGRTGRSGKKNVMRNILLTVQYTASIVLAVAVMVTYAQNQKLQSGAFRYHRDHVVIVNRMSNSNITPHFEALKSGWSASPSVGKVSLSSQVPFNQSTSLTQVTPVSGDENLKVDFQSIDIDQEYTELYDFRLLAGRNLSEKYSEDSFTLDDSSRIEQATVNVLINLKAATALGIESADDAIGKFFYDIGEDAEGTNFRIVGVLGDLNYMGFFSKLRPTVFWMREGRGRIASIRINTDNLTTTLAHIDQVWDELLPDYPIDRQFLDDNFNDIYSIFQGINLALVLFSIIGLSLAIVGLFGMTIYLTNSRVKEIGLRKVLGATVLRLMSMLSFQITRPVLISVFIACPLAYFGMGAYLNFFSDKVELPLIFFVKIGIVVMAIAWIIVGVRAYRAANTNPAEALRYE